MGKPIVMGRKTFESIGKPLPGRQNIVVTRDANYRREGVTVVHGIDEAVRAAGDAAEIMVIGGADLFRLFLPRATRIHLTRVHADVAGDVMWPALDDTLGSRGKRASCGRRTSCLVHDIRGVGEADVIGEKGCPQAGRRVILGAL